MFDTAAWAAVIAKQLSTDTVAYLGIVYMKMDCLEPCAGLAQIENSKYYGKYVEKMSVTQLEFV